MPPNSFLKLLFFLWIRRQPE